MPTNLLLLPLLAGFWFVSTAHYFRFRIQRLDGYWLLLESSVFGIAFAAAARLGVVAVTFTPFGARLADIWKTVSPLPFSGTAFASLCIGLTAPYALNGIFRFFGGMEAARNLAIERHGTDLDRLLNTAIRNQRKVSLSLASRKWYVGYVAKAPSLSPRESYVSILPVMSGFRNANTLVTEATTDYVPIYETGVDRNDFAVTVPLTAITSASFFDDAVYVRFMERKQQESGDSELIDIDTDQTLEIGTD